MKLLQRVDNGPFHARTVRSLSRRDRARALDLLELGWLRRMPKRGRWPARYVVTASGSHALGTFAFS